MHRRIRTAWAGILSGALTAALLASPIPVAARGPVSSASAPTPDAAPAADLAPALAADGSFRGAPGVTGTVDAGAWNLVSNLATGEAPRFAPAAATPSWSALGSNGSGQGALNGIVRALAVSGTDVYVGGDFINAARIPEADYIAKWDGSHWSALGSNKAGNDGALAINGRVTALEVSGSDLYVGGDFINAAGIPEADYIAKWDGSHWSALGSNGAGDGAIVIDGRAVSGIAALAVYNGDLYMGGGLYLGGGPEHGQVEADVVGLAKYSGGNWSAAGSGFTGWISALVVSNGSLYAGGGSIKLNGVPSPSPVVRWDGSSWSALGSANWAVGTYVYALAASGSEIYAGGSFNDAGGDARADNIAKWNGDGWSALGSNAGGTGHGPNGAVYSIAVSGGNVYVGGRDFYNGAGVKVASNVAMWNGSSWVGLGTMSAPGSTNFYAGALAVSGTSLYVGGSFFDAAGIATADFIAKWSPGSVPPAVVRKPDAGIRLGTSGAYLGDNVYNTTGAGQSKTGSAKKGKTVTFGISIQNDGTAADAFKVKATGTAATKFTVKYFYGTKDITAKVVAGTYKTASLAPGATYLITAKVTVKSTAAAGSKVTRLVTITSVASPTQKDAVKFIAKRK